MQTCTIEKKLFYFGMWCYMDIGARIRDLRKSKNLTSRDLALLADISQPVISRLENNTRSADVELIKRICSALGISLADFFADDKEPDQLPPNLLQTISKLKKLTPRQLEIFNSVLDEWLELKGE